METCMNILAATGQMSSLKTAMTRVWPVASYMFGLRLSTIGQQHKSKSYITDRLMVSR
jgi:hypothetical protein